MFNMENLTVTESTEYKKILNKQLQLRNRED